MSLILNGDGSIQNLNAGGLPSATVTQATLATPVAGTGPAFSVFVSSDQAITSGVSTVVAFNSETFDTASCFNNTGSTVGSIPAYSFLPNVAGYYQLDVTINTEAAVSPSRMLVTLSKNSGAVGSKRCLDTLSPLNNGNGATLMYFNGTTDYVTVTCYMTAAIAKMSGDASGQYTYFSGSLVRAG